MNTKYKRERNTEKPYANQRKGAQKLYSLLRDAGLTHSQALAALVELVRELSGVPGEP